MSDPMDDLAAKIARMLAQTDGQPRVMPHNQDDARAVATRGRSLAGRPRSENYGKGSPSGRSASVRA
jgi:hypothetical protein